MTETPTPELPSSYIARLAPTAARIWDIAWERLFHPRTNLFYDYVSSYDPKSRFDHLPTPEEISRRYPNRNGWMSGMEDSVINGGVMLATACDRFAATGEEQMWTATARLFDGLILCGTHSPEPGMVVRSVSPRDGKSYFPETSRDQLTHFAHGLWRFYRSPLASPQQKDSCRLVMTRLCERLERRVTPANSYHFGREDGTPGLVDEMWDVAPHEMPRLPMIYAVAWEMTGDTHWRNMYLRYAQEAVKHASRLNIAAYDACYALFQHQASMETLAAIEDQDEALRGAWCREMDVIANYMPIYHEKILNYQPIDVATVIMDFRAMPNRQEFIDSGYGHVGKWSDLVVNAEFRPLRELGESLLVRLMTRNGSLDARQQNLLAQGLTEVNYDLAITYAMLYPQAAFWRYAANQKR